MKEDYDTSTIVFLKKVDDDQAKEIVSQKKTNVFRKLLRKPKPDEVHVQSLQLFYESILIVSGKYSADFYRKAVHPITVDYNVSEVVLGEGIFPIRSKSMIMKKISKKGKNKVDLKLEEHVFIEKEDQAAFDHHGREIKLPYKINSKTIENYPTKILKMYEKNVKKPEITYESVINKLAQKLKTHSESDVREQNEEFLVKEVIEAYVPIYEARLIGPKKKVGILRIDSVRNKIL
ncbi:MAG: hypothetical protein O6746_00800 [Thaumarchaeota archaeon]|nr:hypothetical protein [Nitrososphaerota archaeon]